MSAGHPPSVLVVEDEGIVAKDLQQTLAAMGYDAFAIAASAEEALTEASARCPDLVLMDIRIKGKRDGIETAELLRQSFGTPIVYLTAHADDATIDRAKRTVPYGYLLKPVKSAELRSAIEVALFKHALERQVLERERLSSTTLLAISDAVVVVDLAGRITFMNQTAEVLTGANAADVLGKPVREVVRLGGGLAEREGTPLDSALRSGQSVELAEASLVNLATGRERLIADSAAPIVDKGQTLGAVMVFRDVTEQRKAQQHGELSDRLASMGTLAAGTAHAVNNPLTVVSANASFVVQELQQHRAELRGGASPEKMEARLGQMESALRDLQTAGDDIGRIISELGSFSLPADRGSGKASLVRAVEGALRAASPELRGRARVVPQLGAVPEIAADEGRLGQVVLQLLVNAAQALGTRDIPGEVRVTTRTDELGRAVLEVADNGPGIEPQALKRIFEPFFTTKPVGAGAGLGLSICHGIVTSMGGTVEAESQPGQGALFRVTLPAAPQPDALSAAGFEGKNKSTGPRRGRVLVVDDEKAVLRAIQRSLPGHELVCVLGATEALSLLERGEHFDVVLLDLMMPVMTGMELYEKILGRDPALVRRVVFISGGSINPRVDAFLRTVSNVCIAKPFDIGHLAKVVQGIVDQPRA